MNSKFQPRSGATLAGADVINGARSARAELGTGNPWAQVPPHSELSEKAALGNVLLAADTGGEWRAMFDQLAVTLFYDLRHGAIFKTIQAVAKSGSTPSTLAVVQRSMDHGNATEVGGVPYVSGLADDVAPQLFGEHLGKLREQSRRRELLRAGLHVASLALDMSVAPETVAADLASFIPRIAEGIGKPREWFTFHTPSELRTYAPPEGARLVGDNVIALGNVTVIGGQPGIGKSRALTALAVAGATGTPWLGLQVHRKFRTAILQNENGRSRLRDEFEAIDPAIEDWIRISSPPAFGLRFCDPGFRSALSAWLADFKPDVLGIDPWNAVAADDKQADFLEAFAAIRSTQPGEHAPAIVIVAHCRKPRTGERQTGRALLAELAGSYALGSVPRAVLVMEPATQEVTDDRVVVTVPKCNDGQTPPRSAWHRRDGGFAPCQPFDWDEFDAPAIDQRRRTVTEDDLRGLFEGGRKIARRHAAAELKERTELGRTACYDATDPNGRFKAHLREEGGLLKWKE